MRRSLGILISLIACCACLPPAVASWQTRDSNYNQSISTSPSEQTVLIDQTATSAALGPGVTGGFTSLNAGAGPNGTSNMMLVAALQFCSGNSGTSVPTSVTWAASSLTKLSNINGASDHIGNGTAGDIYFYYLASPTLGLQTLSVIWTGSNQVVVSAATFVNVDLTGGGTTFTSAVGSTGSGGVPTTTISASPTTRKIVGAFMSATTNFTTTTDTAYAGSPNNSCNVSATAGSWAAGSNTSLAYSPSSSGAWVALGVVLKGH